MVKNSNESHWNYRIVQVTDSYPNGKEAGPWFQMREIYYDGEGNIQGWTSDVRVDGESSEDILNLLRALYHDAFWLPVLSEEELNQAVERSTAAMEDRYGEVESGEQEAREDS